MADCSCLVQNSVIKFNAYLRLIETYEHGIDHSKLQLKRILNKLDLLPNIITETPYAQTMAITLYHHTAC